jgi:uncharacterized membrane protein
MELTATTPPLVCPACGGANEPDAVFCANSTCHKALGEFRYSIEELKKSRAWHESLSERATGFIGKPHSFIFHGIWFTLWALINAGIIAMSSIRPFDRYPFSLLGIILSAEAIIITGFILVSQNLQNQEAAVQAELDYEVNVRTYREIAAVDAKLEAILQRLDRIEQVNQQS